MSGAHKNDERTKGLVIYVIDYEIHLEPAFFKKIQFTEKSTTDWMHFLSLRLFAVEKCDAYRWKAD